MNIDNIKKICELVAKNIYTTQPDPVKIEKVEKLLFMTAAHESDGFRARRQYSFMNKPDKWDKGAFSLFQLEWNSIITILNKLNSNKDLFNRVKVLLESDDILKSVELTVGNKKEILDILSSENGDLLACILCRLHYLFKPGFPNTLEEMSVYAKQYYNTKYGKATPKDYLDAFNRFW